MSRRSLVVWSGVVVGFLVALAAPSASHAADKGKAVSFLKKNHRCDVWFLADLSPAMPTSVGDEAKCIFYGTIEEGTINEARGCVFATFDLNNNTYDMGRFPQMIKGQKCTSKSIDELLGRPLLRGFPQCAAHYIVGGNPSLKGYLKKRFGGCAALALRVQQHPWSAPELVPMASGLRRSALGPSAATSLHDWSADHRVV